MTPEQLWEKYVGNGVMITRDDFLAALKEHGESVRKQAVSVCRDKSDRQRNPSQYREGRSDGCDQCAAAIEKMELP